MCDTMVALSPSTVDRITLFAKNSDRERNESQVVEWVPRADHEPGTHLACTHIVIPQVRRTYAAVICRPFWMWGAEMGANEHGVAIGNQAVHGRIPPQQEKALIGCDLVRLALERAATAAEAVDTIIGLLEEYGQGGNGGHMVSISYDSSYIIADPREAFVLETMQRHWLIERVRGARAISNTYSIGRNPDRVSRNLASYVRDNGWTRDERPDYAQAMTAENAENISHGGARCARSTSLLALRDGDISTADMRAILRDHGADAVCDSEWHPQKLTTYSICMHAGSKERGGQTTGSLISELHETQAVHWVTATAAPCISIFKPILVDTPLPVLGGALTDRSDLATLWWRHERLHRAMLARFGSHLARICAERDAIEAEFSSRIKAVLGGGGARDRERVVAQCWQQAMEAEERWLMSADLTGMPGEGNYRAAWLEMNRLAGLSV